MAKRPFSRAERYAVYVVHGEKCYVCNAPIDLASMQVDHVVPESLLGNPTALAQACTALGLPPTFQVNSYENWMPICGPHNLAKRNMVWRPSPLIQMVLQQAAGRAPRARVLEQQVVSQQQITRALNVLHRANAAGKLTAANKQQLQPLVQFLVQQRPPAMAGQPVRLTPLYEVLSDDGSLLLARGPYGVGGRPSRPDADPSFDCPNCGSMAAWNGARCVTCGQMDE